MVDKDQTTLTDHDSTPQRAPYNQSGESAKPGSKEAQYGGGLQEDAADRNYHGDGDSSVPIFHPRGKLNKPSVVVPKPVIVKNDPEEKINPVKE